MTVHGIMHKTPYAHSVSHKIIDMSLYEIFTQSDDMLNNTYYIIYSVDDEPEKKKSFNASLYFRNRGCDAYFTPQELLESLSQDMLDGYSNDYYEAEKPMETYSVLQDQTIQMNYAEVKTPEFRNKPPYRRYLKDLVLNTTQTCKRDITKTLITVNGMFLIPKIFKGELLLYNGAQYLHSTTQENIPNIAGVDTSFANGYSVVPFSECHTDQTDIHHQENFYANAVITVPDEYDLSQCTPLIIIENRLILPNMVKKLRGNRLVFRPANHPLHLFRVVQKDMSNLPLDGTNIMYRQDEDKQVYSDVFSGKKDETSAIILLHSPFCRVEEVAVESEFLDSLIVDRESTINGSILRDKSSGMLMDYTVQRYDNRDDIVVKRPHEIYQLKEEGMNKPCGLFTSNYNIHEDTHQMRQKTKYNALRFYVSKE